MATRKMKSVHSIRLCTKPGTKDSSPEFKDIAPNTLFDCPADKVEELIRAGAAVHVKVTTPTEASAATSEDEDEDEGTGPTKDELVAEAKALGIKGVSAKWSEEKLADAIAAAKDDVM